MYKSSEELKEWLEEKKFQKRIDKLAKKYEGKKVLIYGAGTLSSVIFENYDLSKLDIVKVADMKFYSDDEKFQEIVAMSPYDIPEAEFDVILIAVYADIPTKEFLEDEIICDIDKKIVMESLVKKSFIEKIKDFVNA